MWMNIYYRINTLIKPSSSSSVLNYNILEHSHYPNYPDINWMKVASSNRSAFINLAPYIDTAAFSIHQSATFQRTYRMFRTLGLRQLIVVNEHNEVLGIVTRVDLLGTRKEQDEGTDGDEDHMHRGGGMGGSLWKNNNATTHYTSIPNETI